MIEFINVKKQFNNKVVFKNITLNIQNNELIVLIGSTASGKTSFLNLIIGKEKVSDGEILINNHLINLLKSYNLQIYRRNIGVIFQDFKLLNKKTVFENIALPLEVCSLSQTEIDKKVKQVIEIVDLKEKIDFFPKNLSGGECQKVAIARAIIHNPKIILADEPTRNLDPVSSQYILDLLKKIHNQLGVTTIITTHNPQVVDYFQTRILYLKDEKIVFDGNSKSYNEIIENFK